MYLSKTKTRPLAIIKISPARGSGGHHEKEEEGVSGAGPLGFGRAGGMSDALGRAVGGVGAPARPDTRRKDRVAL